MNFIHVTRGKFPFENGFFEYFITNTATFGIKVAYTIINSKYEVESRTITLGPGGKTWELTNSLTLIAALIVPDSALRKVLLFQRQSYLNNSLLMIHLSNGIILLLY